jgi:glucose-6-phosphate 1-dehydrogenase
VERALVACRSRAGEAFRPDAWSRFAARIDYVGGDFTEPEVYRALAEHIGPDRSALFYLSTSPALYGPIVQGLKAAGLTALSAGVVVEKPLGHDLASCRALNDVLADAFAETRIFRIDHYLGKETVQNLLALRFANVMFEPIWNSTTIDHIQITVAETLGVEGRRDYYDAYGAMRDMVQNHLLQLLCLVAMEPPARADPDAVRDEKVKVLRSLRSIGPREAARMTVRGQYTAGVSDGLPVSGYAAESDGAASATETFVALCAHVDNWRWAGVPFYLRTGKRLPKRSSEIVVRFRSVPHSLFPESTLQPNTLVIRLQPEERISLTLMNKTAALRGQVLHALPLNLSLSEAYDRDQPRRRIAYERLILEALRGDPTLFVRRDEVEAAWSWVDQIEAGWQALGRPPAPYPAGNWGPPGAFALIERNEHSWAD